MVTLLLIAGLIGGIGILSYYSRAWFGCQASDAAPFPQHYRHLLPPDTDQLPPADQAAVPETTRSAVSVKN